MSDRKQFLSQIKSVNAKQGIVTSVVSVTGNLDAQKDVVLPGAFDRSIAKWKARMAMGQFLPVVYGHKDDPDFILGKVIDLRATDEGLEVDEKFFLSNPKAQTTLSAMEGGVLGGSSFAYDVVKAKSNSHGGLDLAELDLIEVGPTIYPANDATRLVGVKDTGRAFAGAADGTVYEIDLSGIDDSVVAQAFGDALLGAFTKAGRALSARSQQRIRDAIAAHEQGIAALNALLSEYAPPADEGKTEEPDEAKVEDPPVKAELRARLAAALAATV